MKTKIETMLELHQKAEALLYAAQDMGRRIDNHKRNFETWSILGNFDYRTKCFHQIDTCERGQRRLLYSYKKVSMQIAEL
jgi:hypothetical protein